MRKTKKTTIKRIDQEVWLSRDSNSSKVFMSYDEPIAHKSQDGHTVYYLDQTDECKFVYCNNFIQHIGITLDAIPKGTKCRLCLNMFLHCYDAENEILTFNEIENLNKN